MSNIVKSESQVPMKNGMVQLNTIQDALVFAETVFRSGLAPSGFKSAQAIFVAVQMGAELQLSPMQSLQGIPVINGRTSLYDKTARGLALHSGLCEGLTDRFEGSGDDLTAFTVIRRKGVQNDFIGKFSVADAKKAGLWGKVGPWTNYPKDMLAHKASSRALNASFSDVLIGLPVFEDIQDLPPERKAAENPEPVDDPLLTMIPKENNGRETKSSVEKDSYPSSEIQSTLEPTSIAAEIIDENQTTDDQPHIKLEAIKEGFDAIFGQVSFGPKKDGRVTVFVATSTERITMYFYPTELPELSLKLRDTFQKNDQRIYRVTFFTANKEDIVNNIELVE